MIAVHHLWKAFYDERQAATVVAVEDVSLEVQRGEFVCICGPSGCGKSTLIRILAGLEDKTLGRIDLAGGQRTRPPVMVFQEASLFPWRTVRENVGYPLEIQGVARAERERRIGPMLEMTKLSDFADSYPHQLSGGMKQRASVARALIDDSSDILLMDEPFGALDEQTRLQLQQELLRIWERSGKTVVFITHSVEEALTLGDRVLVMSARPGRIVADIAVPFGRPRNVLAMRRDPLFGEVGHRVWSLLRQEHSADDEAPAAAATVAAAVPIAPAAKTAPETPATVAVAAVTAPQVAPGASAEAVPAPEPAASVAPTPVAGGDGRSVDRAALEALVRPSLWARSLHTVGTFTPLLVLLAWELLGRAGVVDVRFFPAPSMIAHTFWEEIASGNLLHDALASTGRVAVGYVMGGVPALLLALALGLWRTPRALILPIFSSLYTVPKIALYPLLLLLFGLGEMPKYVLVALSTFFLIFFNSLTGVLQIPRIYLDVARNVGTSTAQLFRTVALPAALPGIFNGMRLAFGTAFVLLAAVEFVGAKSGLGYSIWSAWQTFAIEKMYVGIVSLSVIGYLCVTAVRWVEQKTVPWIKH
ncbi:MAG: ATP-binding cassette domain-containing protein [Caldimonas sp.]